MNRSQRKPGKRDWTLNAGTRLVALVSLLWVLLAVGGPPGEPTQGGFTAKGINLGNHNETMVRDAGPLARTAGWSDWLRNALASVFAKVASRPGGDCDEFGCGGNHHETLVRDAAR